MKQTIIILISILTTIGCEKHAHMKHSDFKAEKELRTATFVVNGTIDEAFPLFSCYEEQKWEPNWKPVFIYPEEENLEEGTTFKTHGHGDEPEFLWRVSKYEKDNNLIQYLVSTENRYWTITVECAKHDDESKTNTTVTYSYIGLNDKGNELNHLAAQHMYANNLQDWATAINAYLDGL